MSTFHLVDDGTLDTVVACDSCGAHERYNYAHSETGACEHGLADCEACYTAWQEWVLEDAAEQHECAGHDWDAFGDVR
jgi:hypothetical protein